MQRPICSACNTNECAINYKKEDKVYYRSQCDSCLFKIKKKKTQWMKDGYKKKFKCESCDFLPKIPNQLTVVVYNEGYRTVCLNCSVLSTSQNLTVKKGDLKADF
jgi:hypothetical protein